MIELADIVRVKSNLTNAELTECVRIVAAFFMKNRDEIKRTMRLFPDDASTKPKALEMVLREGIGMVETLNEYEEDTAILKELDEMHEANIFVYGDEYRVECAFKKE